MLRCGAEDLLCKANPKPVALLSDSPTVMPISMNIPSSKHPWLFPPAEQQFVPQAIRLLASVETSSWASECLNGAGVCVLFRHWRGFGESVQHEGPKILIYRYLYI